MLIAGVDEVGRGCLCGEVITAAVILSPNKPVLGLDDSKKLTAQKREKLYDIICEQAIAYSIGKASVTEIDQLNILHATMLAMQRALLALKVTPELALIDGNRCPENLPFASQAVVKGDSKEACIAAASVIAKVTRDRIMLDLDKLYPEYGLAQHKGYPTKQHLVALQQNKPNAIYRKSFAPVRAACRVVS